jgi:membrane protease YdiL (CAAX protease family)
LPLFIGEKVIPWQEAAAIGTSYLSLAVAGAAVLGGLWWSVPRFGKPLLTMPRIRRVSWNGFDVFAIFLMIYIVPPLVGATLRDAGFFDWLYGDAAMSSPGTTIPAAKDTGSGGQTLTLERMRELFWSKALASPLLIALIVVGLATLRQARPRQLGLTATRLGSALCVAYVVWLAVTPAALLINFLAESMMPAEFVDPHTIVRAGAQGLAFWDWALLVAVVTVIGPLEEEVVFRGVCLSWQLRRGWEAQATIAVIAFLVAIQFGVRPEGKSFNPWPLLYVLVLLPVVFVLPFWSRQRTYLATELRGEGESPENHQENTLKVQTDPPLPQFIQKLRLTLPGPWLAIFTNGLLFAATHSFAWPTPIALTLLGIALAWVRYRTASLAGCVLIHSLFNAASTIALILAGYWTA